MKKYTATLKNGSPITSVHATNPTAAELEINRQLSKNPQRREIRALWHKHGSRITEE